MSKGPGWVENAVKESLRKLVRPTAARLAAAVYDVPETQLTRAQLGAVRRVLRRFVDAGIATAEVPETAATWKLVGRHARTPTTAPPQGDTPAHVPFTGSTRTLGLRREPVRAKRIRSPITP